MFPCMLSRLVLLQIVCGAMGLTTRVMSVGIWLLALNEISKCHHTHQPRTLLQNANHLTSSGHRQMRAILLSFFFNIKIYSFKSILQTEA
jgi:hypothetical protein